MPVGANTPSIATKPSGLPESRSARLLMGTCLLEGVGCQHVSHAVRLMGKQTLDGTPG